MRSGKTMRAALVGAIAAGALAGPAARAQEASPDALRESYKDWQVVCQRTAEAGQVCEMTQELRQKQGGRRVLAASIRATGEGAGVLVLITPFGLKLAEPVRLRIEETELVQAPFSTCLPAGCVAQAPLSSDAITAFQKGAAVKVVMTPVNGGAATAEVSLAGFTAAWERLGEL